MLPRTEKTPKTLLPVDGDPFAHFQLSWLAAHGVCEVVYCVAVLGEQVRSFVRDGQKWGLDVAYVEDGPELAGTAGALRRAYDAGVLREWFLVLYGDSFLPIDFRAVGSAFQQQQRPALMVVYRNQGRFDKGNVRFADGVVQLYRKAPKNEGGGEPTPPEMDYIDYGLSAFRSDLIAAHICHGQKADLADLCHLLSLDGQLAGLEAEERFYEIGSPAGMRDFEQWTREHPIESWVNL
jgi:NDP-sugar pyrophosphorylase family protein